VGGNLFTYIQLPGSAGAVAGTGDSLGIPNCTGLNHVGCTYTASGAGYPDRNQFKSPGFWTSNMIFYKDFHVTERVGLQFRGEFYNIFNHSNQYISVLNLDVSSISAASPFVQTEKGGKFGSAGFASDENRRIQLGLRLSF
jgi:hypothetical protein